MTGKTTNHHPQNHSYWAKLIERYYAGGTSLREEEELCRFLFSPETNDPGYDEIKAVISFTETGKQWAKHELRIGRNRRLQTFTGIAACIAIALGIGIFYIATPKETCITYIYGEKHTDPETVIEQMRHSISQFAPTDITIEEELGAIFSPLENPQ